MREYSLFARRQYDACVGHRGDGAHEGARENQGVIVEVDQT